MRIVDQHRVSSGPMKALFVALVVTALALGCLSWNAVTSIKRIQHPLVLVLLLVCSVYGYNYFRLQSEVNEVVSLDSRNDGIGVSVHYAYYVDPSTLVYDLRSISSGKSMADVFRVFLQFSDKMQSQRFTEVELLYRGNVKFTIAGGYFQPLGNDAL